MNNKPIAVGLVFGVGLALALNNWLLRIMFGLIFYVLIWILNFIAPGILVMELYLIILLVLIIRGLNHYFGWIKILKKD